MNLPAAPIRTRPISAGCMRAFLVVARLKNFRAAAQELSLTQSAVSRQIQSLEHEVGTALFVRHTRSVELSAAGAVLLRATQPALDSVDNAVRQIRQSLGRQSVTITTWASFASLWLSPRLEAFQEAHPDIDIRIDATDAAVDLATADVDVALRCTTSASVPAGTIRMFGEQLTAVASPWLLKSQPIAKLADLAHCTLIEDSDTNTAHRQGWYGWQHWLTAFDPTISNAKSHTSSKNHLQPKRWLYFNYTHQIAQAALTGQGVALARLPLVAESLVSGNLVEVLPDMRLSSPLAYWLLVAPRSKLRPEVRAFCDWLRQQAHNTRLATGDVPDPETLASPD
jgi:DNA-binding transcriptional LysR family regulator